MNAVREFPPNPHALVIHTDDPVTDEVVETYLPGARKIPRAWVRDVLELPGVRVLSLNAYKVRLQKRKDVDWQSLLAPFESIVQREFGIETLVDLVEEESRTRCFAWHGESFERAVFEGRRQARGHDLARSLFGLAGVAEVILDGHEVQVRKCPLRRWRELAPEIERALVVDGD